MIVAIYAVITTELAITSAHLPFFCPPTLTQNCWRLKRFSENRERKRPERVDRLKQNTAIDDLEVNSHLKSEEKKPLFILVALRPGGHKITLLPVKIVLLASA